jgi:hypothetical protein
MAQQFPDPAVDSSHATDELVRQVTTMYRDKTERNVDRTMAHFSGKVVYTDATLGWRIEGWETLKSIFGQYMPAWPDTARSYPTRIIGDEHSAIVMFTDSPELFGHELRIVAALDFEDGKVTREADYWDGRHFGIEAAQALRTQLGTDPATYGEDLVPDQSSPVLQNVLGKLREALSSGAAAGLFSVDAVFEDLTLQARIVGAQAVEGFLERAHRLLPYGGRPATVRHTVGSAQGGGYEWQAADAPVKQGIVAVELDEQQRITRLTTVWDGAAVGTEVLAEQHSALIEH